MRHSGGISRNPDVWLKVTSGSRGRGRRRGLVARYLRFLEVARFHGDGGEWLERACAPAACFCHVGRVKMAAAEAVEEMRSRVVLGEFGVRNVSPWPLAWVK